MRYSKEEILKAVYIDDVARKLQIGLEQVSTGNFTHRCRCPSIHHKSGTERTSSLYIDSVNNNFYCFGCGASNNVIDFYMLCKDVDFSSAITDLSSYVDPSKLTGEMRRKKTTNFSYLLRISNLFRDLQRRKRDDIEWIEALMLKTDSYLSNIDRHDVAKTRALLSKLNQIVKRRYQKQ